MLGRCLLAGISNLTCKNLPPLDQRSYDKNYVRTAKQGGEDNDLHNLPISLGWRRCILPHSLPSQFAIEASNAFQDGFCDKRVRVGTDLRNVRDSKTYVKSEESEP